MARESVYQGRALAGTERYGAVRGVEQAAVLPSYIQSGSEPCAPSGNKYQGRQGVCSHVGKDHLQCKGPRALGTEFCIGHLRAIEKFIKATQEQTEEEDDTRTE
jgi:hypothetical protein